MYKQRLHLLYLFIVINTSFLESSIMMMGLASIDNIDLSIHPSVSLFIHPSIHSSIHPSIHPSVSLFFYLSMALRRRGGGGEYDHDLWKEDIWELGIERNWSRWIEWLPIPHPPPQTKFVHRQQMLFEYVYYPCLGNLCQRFGSKHCYWHNPKHSQVSALLWTPC